VAPETWRIGEPPPDDVVPLLGIWFMEAARLVFRWREGKLEARFDGTRTGGLLRLRAGDGRSLADGLGLEHGEALRIVRAEDGSVERMVWAGYPVTREPGPWKAPNRAYSYCRASRTFSFPARRAGKIAASRPTIIAATANTISCPIGSAKTMKSMRAASSPPARDPG
jgi:hypothetical protein